MILPAGVGTTPATTTTAATAAVSAATAGPRRLRTRFIHRQRAAAHLVSVELRDGLLRFVVAAHLDKSKPARTPGGAVAHDGYGINITRLGKQRLQLVFSGFEWDIPNEEFAAHVRLSCAPREGDA